MALKLPRLKLHNQILLALVLGALFGAFFNISTFKLAITYHDQHGVSSQEVVEDFTMVDYVAESTGKSKASFGAADQLKIISYFNSLNRAEKKTTILHIVLQTGEEIHFQNVVGVEKVKTIATMIKPVGTVFIRLLMLIAIPLVFASLIVGAASLGDLKRVGTIGAKTVGLYLLSIISAISLGLGMVNYIQPGTRLDAEAKEKLMAEFQGGIQEKIQQEVGVDLVDMFVRIVATNPVKAMADGEMLQIIFFALMIGVSLTMIQKDKAAVVVSFFDGFSDVMIRMVDLIMKIAPFGVFALISATVGEFGFGILQTLAWYAATLIAALLVHQFVTLGGMVRILGRMSPIRFFKGIKEVMLIAFSSSSSAATLPVNMEACEKNLGVPKEMTSFVLPLGATINMDGTSMYQAVAAVFIAQVYGVDLSLAEQLTILLTAVLASIGTAPVPGVGIIMLIIVLRSVNIPEEGIALILGIDRILDMCRTVVNVSGDAAVAVIIARHEGVLQPEPVSAS